MKRSNRLKKQALLVVALGAIGLLTPRVAAANSLECVTTPQCGECPLDAEAVCGTCPEYPRDYGLVCYIGTQCSGSGEEWYCARQI